MKITVFWDVMLCSLVGSYCVRGTRFLPFQGRRVNPEDGGSRLLLNIGNYLAAYMVTCPRRQ
jgi:hypothetical protein